MPLVVKDRVKETSSTAGTGTLTLSGAVAGFQSFSVIGNGNTTYYTIVDPTTGDWEVGIGTYTSSGTTLSRDTILESSNSGSAVPFGSDPKDVFVTYPAEYAGFSTNLQEFSTSGTWAKPETATTVLVELWGAGGGGGSGRLGAAASARTGGGGGGGGAYSYQIYDAADVPSSLTVTIGAGGSGGAAITVSNTNGSSGTVGGNTTFGSLLSAFGGAGGFNGSAFNVGGGGGGGRTSAGSSSTAGEPVTVTASTSLANIFGGGAGLSGQRGQASVYGGSGGGGVNSGTGAAFGGGLTVYGGGGANGGGGITSANLTNSLITTTTNYFGSNALGGSAFYYTSSNAVFPSIIGSDVFTASATGLISYSSDATNFTTVTPEKGGLLGRVSSDGTNYIITTATGAFKSTDLSTWTEIATSITGVSWRNSLYANSKYILVGYANGSAAIAVSSDLTSWTTYSVSGSSDYWDDVQYDGTYFVVSGGGAGGPDVARSTDGTSWTHVPITGMLFFIQSIAVTASEWVAATLNNTDFNTNFFRSTDSGSTWTSVLATGGSSTWYISYVNSGFVAIGDNSYRTSSDGSTWSSATSTGLSVFPRLAVLLGTDIVYGASSATIAKSSTAFGSWASVATIGVGANGTNGSTGLTAGGGGGGGAATNTFTSGAGGAGGNGFARITAW
jgi:hypothetical protein